MQIDIKATNIKLASGLREYIERKINHLKKFIDSPDSSVRAWVEVGRTTRHHQTGNVFRAEIEIHFPHHPPGVRTEANADDIFAAIDEAQAEMKNELAKIKERKISLFKKGARIFKKLYETATFKRTD